MNDIPSTTMNKTEKFLFGIGMFLYLVLIIASFAIHIWTVLIAYDFGGTGTAFLTLVLPFFSQVFWATYHIITLKTLLDPYLMGLIIYILLLLLMMLCLVLSTSRSRCEINRD